MLAAAGVLAPAVPALAPLAAAVLMHIVPGLDTETCQEWQRGQQRDQAATRTRRRQGVSQGNEVSGVLWDGLLEKDPEMARQQVGDLMAAIADGSLAPRITERFTLEQGLDALKTLAERRVTGKVIVTPN